MHLLISIPAFLIFVAAGSLAVGGYNTETLAGGQPEQFDMGRKLPSKATIRRNALNDTIFYLKGANLSELLERDESFRDLQSKDLTAEIALSFLAAYRSVFHLVHPPDELSVTSVTTDNLGLKHVRLQQVFEGIPVWASEMMVHLNQSNQVYLVHGRYIPTPSGVKTRPVLSEEQAFRIVAENLKRSARDCPDCHSELVIFGAAGQNPRLAYRVIATPSLVDGWAFIIDSETGAVLQKLPTVHDDDVPIFEEKRPFMRIE